MKIDSLKEGRVKMALNFAKKSLKQDTFSSLFPLNENVHQMKTRNPERYVIKDGNTDRMKRSAVPFLQRLLNEDIKKQRKDLRNLLQVNNGICFNALITLYTIIIMYHNNHFSIITSPSRAWLRRNAFLVLACLLARLPNCLPACLQLRLLSFLLSFL